jgi:hypothetical protein
MLLGASVASASEWYVGARFGGMSNTWLRPYWYNYDYYDGGGTTYPYEYLRHTEGGIFDFREVTVGLRKGLWSGELGFGLSNATWSEDLDQRGGTFEESVNWRVISLAGLYEIMEPDPIELDLGARFQLHSATWEWRQDYDDDGVRATTEDIDKVSGWSFGPLARARWYFGDGALAIGPEVYFKYTSLTYDYEYSNGSEFDFTADITSWDTEYSFRLEMFF